MCAPGVKVGPTGAQEPHQELQDCGLQTPEGAPLTSLPVFLSPARLLTLVLTLQIPGQFQAASYTLLLLTVWVISLFL